MVDLINSVTTAYAVSGLDTTMASLDRIAQAEARLARQSADLSSASAGLDRSTLSAQRALDGFSRGLDPAAKALAVYERGLRLANTATAQGAPLTDAHARALSAAKARWEEASKATNDNAKALHGHADATKISGMQLAEFGHIGRAALDELGAGMGPMQVLRTEGARLVQAFSEGQGGVAGTFKALGFGVLGAAQTALGFVNPLTLATAATAGFGLVAYNATSNVRALRDEMDRAVSGAGRFAGLSGEGLNSLATASASRTGVSLGDSRATAEALASSGRFDAGNISGVMGLTRGMAGAYGVSNADAGAKLADMLADPVKGLDQLNERLGFLDDRTRQSVQSLVAQGNAQGALRLAVDAASTSLNEMVKPQGPFDRLTSWWSERNAQVEARISGIVSGPSPQQQYIDASGAGGRVGLLGVMQSRGRYDDGTATLAEDFRHQSMLSGGSPIMRSQQDSVIANRQSTEGGDVVRAVLPDITRYQTMADQQKKLMDAIVNPDALKVMGVTADQAHDALDRLTTGLTTFQTNAERIIQQSSLTVAGINAETFAEKQAVEYQKNYIDALNQTHSALEASLTAEAKRAEAIAKSNDAADKWVQQQQNQNALLGLKPAQRLAVERDQGIADAKSDGGLNGASGRAAGLVTPAMLAMAQAYVAAGYNPHAVAGFVGGTTTESGTNLDPAALNASGHRGIAQWDASRWGLGQSVMGSGLYTQGGQTQFSLAELATTEKRAGGILSGSNSVLGGVLASDAYERPGDVEALRRRDTALARGNALDAALTAGVSGSGVAPINSTGTQTRVDQYNDNYAKRTKNLSDTIFNSADDDLDKRTAAFNLQASAVGLSADKLAVLNERLKLNNQLNDQGLTPTKDQTARINQIADSYGAQAKRESDFANQQKSLISTEDSVRSFTSNSAETLFEGLAAHKPANQLLRGIGVNLGDSLIKSGVGSITSGLFGKSGQAGGGLFGGLLGDVASFLPHYAAGTNDALGGPSLVGERGPEIVNLPKGSQVVPNGQGLGRGAAGHTFNFGDVHIHPVGGAQFTDDQVSQIRSQVAAGQQDTMQQIVRNLPQIQSDAAQTSGIY